MPPTSTMSISPAMTTMTVLMAMAMVTAMTITTTTTTTMMMMTAMTMWHLLRKLGEILSSTLAWSSAAYIHQIKGRRSSRYTLSPETRTDGSKAPVLLSSRCPSWNRYGMSKLDETPHTPWLDVYWCFDRWVCIICFNHSVWVWYGRLSTSSSRSTRKRSQTSN